MLDFWGLQRRWGRGMDVKVSDPLPCRENGNWGGVAVSAGDSDPRSWALKAQAAPNPYLGAEGRTLQDGKQPLPAFPTWQPLVGTKPSDMASAMRTESHIYLILINSHMCYGIGQ